MIIAVNADIASIAMYRADRPYDSAGTAKSMIFSFLLREICSGGSQAWVGEPYLGI